MEQVARVHEEATSGRGFEAWHVLVKRKRLEFFQPSQGQNDTVSGVSHNVVGCHAFSF